MDIVDIAIAERRAKRRAEELREEKRKQRKLNMLKQKGIALLIIVLGILCVVYFAFNPLPENNGSGAFFLMIIAGLFLFLTDDVWYAT